MQNSNNDWLATLMFNPDKDVNNLKVAGLTADNTKLKPKEDYLSVPEIKEAFKTEGGDFDSTAFDQYYNSALRLYNSFVADELNDKLYNDYLYSPLDLTRDSEDKAFTPNFSIEKVANPMGKTFGVSSLFGEGAPTRSMREAAQTQRVYNWETKEFENWTPNDDDKRGIFDFFSIPTLVEATWDEDGTHIENGREIKHYKGMQKLNADGMPYYETLGNRDISSKKALHLTDTLTVDGSTWNKYDIFDNDGIDKSVTGTTMNIVANIVPLFIPYVGPIYKWATIGLGLSKALGTFGKSTSDVFYTEKPKLWEYFNNLDSFAARFDSSVSDYGQENVFSWEGIGNIIKDSVKQLYQQREIAKASLSLSSLRQKQFIKNNNKTYLSKFGKTFEEALKDGDVDSEFFKAFNVANGVNSKKINKVARDMSSMYMALTQSADVYNTMKEADFSPEYTAIGMIASLVGFKKIMDSELGDVALQGLGMNETKMATKQFLKDYLGDIRTALNQSDLTTKAGKFAAIKKISNIFESGIKKVKATPLLASAAKEGLEEVSEELLQDSILGMLTAVDKVFFDGTGANYNFLESNPLERYGTAFLGGVIGGTIFKGVELAETRAAGLTRDIPKSALRNLETVLRNGGVNEVLEVVDKYIKQGKIASTKLSMDVNEDASNSKETVFKVATDIESSQNNVIGEYIKNYIKSINRFINEENLALTDSQIINSAVGKDIKIQELASNGIDQDILNDFTEMLTTVVSLRSELASTKDSDKDKLSEVQSKLSIAQNEIKDFLNGGNKGRYLEEIVFQLNRSINLPYMSPDIYTYALSKGKSYLSMSENEKKVIDSEFKKLKDNSKGYRRQAFKIFKAIRESIQNDLSIVSSENTKELWRFKEYLNGELDKLSESLGVLSVEEKNTIRKDIKDQLLKDLSNDDVIQNFGLNTNQHKLTDHQKDNLINKFIESTTEYNTAVDEATFRKRAKDVAITPGLGIDSDILMRSNQDITKEIENLQKLINLISEAQSKFGFIDSATSYKIDSILNHYNKLNISERLSNIKLSDVANRIQNQVIELKGKYSDLIPEIANNGDSLLTDYFVSRSTLTYDAEVNKFIITYYLNEGVENSLLASLEDLEGEEIELSDGTPIDLNQIIEDKKFSIELTPKDVQELIISESNRSKNLNSWTSLNEAENSNLIKLILQDDILNARMDLILSAQKLQATIINNPILSALDTISIALSGDSITKVLGSEEANYRSLSSLDDYVIANNITEQQLRTLKTAIEILKSQLVTSLSLEDNLYDFNRILNSFRKSVGLDEFVTIDENTLSVASTDLHRLELKVNYLIALHENNAGSKLQNSKKTSLKINGLLTLILTGGKLPPLMYTNSEGVETNLLDLSGVLSETEVERLEYINSTAQLSDDNHKFVLECLFKVKQSLYDKFQALDEDSKTTIITRLASDTFLKRDLSHETDIKRNSTENDLSNSFISDYIFMSLISDPTDFITRFKKICIENPSQYAPFAGQLLDIEFNWCMLTHSEDLNLYLQEVVKGSSNNDIKNNYNYIPNTIFNLGDPGSGKTTAVAWFTNKMLLENSPNAKVWCVAPKKGMADKLATLLGYSTSFSKDELFNSILTESGKSKYQNIIDFFRTNKAPENLIENGSTDKLNTTYFTVDDFIPEVPDVIFIDEVTHFNFMETTLLGNIVSKSGIKPKIIALGDPNQSGAENSKGISISGDQGVTFKSPNLNMSVRADNTTKQDNLMKMSSILKEVLKQANLSALNGMKFDPSQYIKLIQNDLSLKYYDGLELHGEKIVHTKTLKSELNTLLGNLKEGERIALITDKSSGSLIDLFNSVDQSKTTIVNENDVQGSEYKYAIVDVAWKDIKQDSSPADFVSELKRAYTLFTRSSVGTIVVDDNDKCLFKRNESVAISKKVEIDNSDVTEYSKFILSSLANIGTTSTQSVDNVSQVKNVDNIAKTPSIVEVTPQKVKQAQEQLTEKNTLPESFLNKNLAVYSGFYFKGNDFEDINGLTSDEGTNKIGLVNLKSLLLNNRSKIEELLDRPNNSLFTSIYQTFASKYFPSSSFEDSVQLFKKAILNGNFAIKVKRAESGDIPYNRPEVEGSPEIEFKYPVIGSTITKLVYRIPVSDIKTFDISIGYIGDKDIPETVAKYIQDLKIQAGNSGKVSYIDFNRDYKFTVRGIDIRPGIDIYGNIIDDKKNTKAGSREVRLQAMKNSTVAKLKAAHPELNISDPIVLTEDMRPSQENNAFFAKKGQPIVLASRDLFMTQEQMLDKYTEYIKGGDVSVLDGITPIWVTPIGVTTKEFITLWKELYHRSTNNISKMGHQYLGGYMQGPRFLNVLTGMKKYLNDPVNYNPDVKKKAQTYWPRKEQLNKLFTGDINTVLTGSNLEMYRESLNNVLTRLRSFITTSEHNPTGLPVNYSRLSPKGLNLNKDQVALLEKTIQDKSNEAIPFMAALETLKDTSEEFNTVYTAFNEINLSKAVFSSKVEKLFEMGLLPPIVAGVEILDTIAKAYSQDSNFETLLNYAIESSPQFVGGIQLNYINSVDEIVNESGIVNSGLLDSELYVDQYIGNPRFYLDYESLDLKSQVETQENISENTDTNTKNTFDITSILESTKNVVNLYLDKFKEKSFNTFSSKLKLDILEVGGKVSTLEEAINTLNDIFDSKYSYGALYDDNRELVAVFPKIEISASGDISLSNEERLANRVFSGYSTLLSQSIQATSGIRIPTQAFNPKSSNTVVPFIKFLNSRFFAIKLNENIYTGQLRMEGGKTIFKLLPVNSPTSKTLLETNNEIIKEIPNYNKC